MTIGPVCRRFVRVLDEIVDAFLYGDEFWGLIVTAGTGIWRKIMVLQSKYEIKLRKTHN